MDTFEKLSGIDVRQYVEKKGNLDYLPWAAAWSELVKAYPEARYILGADTFFNDGSCQVQTMVEVDGKALEMWLPVMDHKNKAIANPSARDISDARMRCLTKNIAMFGLGISLYMKDFAVPQKVSTKPQKTPFADTPMAEPAAALAAAKTLDELAIAWGTLNRDEQGALLNYKDELKEDL